MSIDKRLRWRCRRGTREMDLILKRFLDVSGPALDESEVDSLGRLLDEADQDILDWMTDRASPPSDPGITALVQRIRSTVGGPGVEP